MPESYTLSDTVIQWYRSDSLSYWRGLVMIGHKSEKKYDRDLSFQMSNLPSAGDMVKMLKILITFAMCTTQLKSKRECWSCIWCCLISSNPWYPSLQEVVALRNTENRFFRSIMSIAELSEWHMGNYLSQNSEWNHFTESYCCNKWMHATDFAEPSIAPSGDLDVGSQSNYQPEPKT